MELSPAYEYRVVRVHNPSAVWHPFTPDAILGRKAHDIMPGDLMEKFDRAIFTAARTQRPATYIHTHDDGTTWQRRVIAPTADLVVATIERL